MVSTREVGALIPPAPCFEKSSATKGAMYSHRIESLEREMQGPKGVEGRQGEFGKQVTFIRAYSMPEPCSVLESHSN